MCDACRHRWSRPPLVPANPPSRRKKAAAASKFDFENGLTFEHFGWSIMEVRAGSVAQARVARRAR